MNGVEVVAEILKREGTDFLSCYPRTPLIEACAKIGIRPILCRQERVGIGIADAYTRLNCGRRNGVFAMQGGPGTENSFAGVAQAFSENVSVLIISTGGNAERQHIRPGFSAVDNFRHIAKWVARVNDTKLLPDVFRRAYHAMRTGRGGPVVIEVADETWTAPFAGELDYVPVQSYRSGPDPEGIKVAVAALTSAKAPLIWAGQGVIQAGASDLLVKLAELLPAPVMTTNPGKSAFPENHPLSLGGAVVSASKPLKDYLNKADWVFAIGSSLTKTPFGPKLPPGKRIVHATNDAGDINKDYRVDHALIGDARLVLEAMIDALKSRDTKAASKKLSQDVSEAKAAWRKEWMPQLTSAEVPINQYRIIWDLMNNTDPANTIITHDAGSPREQLFPFWESVVSGSYIGWGKSTQLGHGLGLAIGAKLTMPDKLCINVMGDSAIGMTGMDLETAVRNKIASLTIVFNNGVMAAERDTLITATEKYGAYHVGGNYTKVAEGLGMEAIRVEKPDAFVPALKKAKEAIAAGRPFLIECITKEGYDFSR